jgi:hypothetical protein
MKLLMTGALFSTDMVMNSVGNNLILRLYLIRLLPRSAAAVRRYLIRINCAPASS